MKSPKMIVNHADKQISFYPKAIDRENRIFLGDAYRLLGEEEAQAFKEMNGVAPIPGRTYLAPIIVGFDEVVSVHAEAAMAFRLGTEFKVWAGGHDSDRKMDVYKNSLESCKK